MSDPERTDRNACPEPLTDDDIKDSRPLWELSAERHAQLVVTALDERTKELMLVHAGTKRLVRERFDDVLIKIGDVEKGLVDVKRLSLVRSIGPAIAIGMSLATLIIVALVTIPTVARAAGVLP